MIRQACKATTTTTAAAAAGHKWLSDHRMRIPLSAVQHNSQQGAVITAAALPQPFTALQLQETNMHTTIAVLNSSP
jgi:hypothetical protein